MKANWPQLNLTTEEWNELLGIEYTLTMYPTYYGSLEGINQAIARLNELREKRHK